MSDIYVGQGKFLFHVNHCWAKLPPSVRLGYTHGIVESADGRIFIANQSEHAIVSFSPTGEFLESWGSQYASGAHGLRLSRENDGEFFYLANTSLAQVVKTTLDGKVIWQIGTPMLPAIYDQEKKFSPTEVAVASDGRFYVTDGYGQSRVHVYDGNAKYLHTFGSLGEKPGELREPHGIGIDSRSGKETLLIANRANRRIDRFDLNGAFIETVISAAHLRYPCTPVVAGQELYVPDLFGRVSIFDGHNNLICHLCDYLDGREWNQSWGHIHKLDPGLANYPNIATEHRKQGKFSSPHGLCVDHKSNVFVVEWIEDGRITKLTRAAAGK